MFLFIASIINDINKIKNKNIIYCFKSKQKTKQKKLIIESHLLKSDFNEIYKEIRISLDLYHRISMIFII